MPEPITVLRPHPATLDTDTLLRSCEIGKGRAGGPGGQHRNKVETLVIIHHLPTGLEAHAGERRSAEQNRRRAIFRLRLRLALEARAPVPLGEIRSELWKSRCDRSGRIACNPEHDDYPAMLAEALDVISACGLDVKKASLRLCCTSSQLVGLLADHPPALAHLNRARADASLGPLR